MLYQLPMEKTQIGKFYNALKLSYLEETLLCTPWKNNYGGMEKIGYYQKNSAILTNGDESLPENVEMDCGVYPTTKENRNPKALAMSMNVESCMSVCPCSSEDMYSRFLPIRSPNCCCVSF